VREYSIVDVFTDAPLEGNPVAVFANGAGLSGELMQRAARELNLSETVFLLAADGEADAQARIFTPARELPFAGHPVLGTAFLVGAALGKDTIALETGAECARLNGLEGRIAYVKQDARKMLAQAKALHDLVIVDPPRLAPSRGSRDAALIFYSKLAEAACRATVQGGSVVLCSCSAAVDLAALTRALATGARRANVEATVLERGFQGADHPTSAAFGEGVYLKWVIAHLDAR